MNRLSDTKLNILVTGGAGFIGSGLVQKLLNEGHFVTSIDNYFTGSKENHVNGCKYLNKTTSDCWTINKKNIDIIYHLGEYSRVEQSFDDIDLVFKYNWNSIYSVLSLARDTNAKLIYAGSSTKYADEGNNYKESPYAYTKYINADLVNTFCKWNNMNYAITYFYNVYGKKEISQGDYATVVGKFLHAKKNGIKTVNVTKPGTQKRNFTHIDDIVEGLFLVGLEGNGDGYGIGSDTSYSIIELANLFGLKIKYVPERKGNRMNAPVINHKIKELGWIEKNSLKTYINKYT